MPSSSLPIPDGPAREVIDGHADLTPSFSPDGHDLISANRLIWSVAAEYRRTPPPEPTSWLRMTEAERAQIRGQRRRGHLRLVTAEETDTTRTDAKEAA